MELGGFIPAQHACAAPQTPAEGFNIRLSVSLGFFFPYRKQKSLGEKKCFIFCICGEIKDYRVSEGLVLGSIYGISTPGGARITTPDASIPSESLVIGPNQTRGCEATQARLSGSGVRRWLEGRGQI